ncbi:hypothetical protein A8135_03060 [Legionella jamestowniensis]|uniref:Ubiquitin-like protease family profile domain-containing protein n=1 Tax=Legionella jamestowniensis TaxID=455 RepID=A0ABX2XU79_9GAMM|nr:hypothetical protein [Legionella jamestowniensis]OCH97469.1 hypothetical protein A8135_03060 [Legionella jamestowniensis]
MFSILNNSDKNIPQLTAEDEVELQLIKNNNQGGFFPQQIQLALQRLFRDHPSIYIPRLHFLLDRNINLPLYSLRNDYKYVGFTYPKNDEHQVAIWIELSDPIKFTLYDSYDSNQTRWDDAHYSRLRRFFDLYPNCVIEEATSPFKHQEDDWSCGVFVISHLLYAFENNHLKNQELITLNLERLLKHFYVAFKDQYNQKEEEDYHQAIERLDQMKRELLGIIKESNISTLHPLEGFLEEELKTECNRTRSILDSIHEYKQFFNSTRRDSQRIMPQHVTILLLQMIKISFEHDLNIESDKVKHIINLSKHNPDNIQHPPKGLKQLMEAFIPQLNMALPEHNMDKKAYIKNLIYTLLNENNPNEVINETLSILECSYFNDYDLNRALFQEYPNEILYFLIGLIINWTFELEKDLASEKIYLAKETESRLISLKTLFNAYDFDVSEELYFRLCKNPLAQVILQHYGNSILEMACSNADKLLCFEAISRCQPDQLNKFDCKHVQLILPNQELQYQFFLRAFKSKNKTDLFNQLAQIRPEDRLFFLQNHLKDTMEISLLSANLLNLIIASDNYGPKVLSLLNFLSANHLHTQEILELIEQKFEKIPRILILCKEARYFMRLDELQFKLLVDIACNNNCINEFERLRSLMGTFSNFLTHNAIECLSGQTGSLLCPNYNLLLFSFSYPHLKNVFKPVLSPYYGITNQLYYLLVDLKENNLLSERNLCFVLQHFTREATYTGRHSYHRSALDKTDSILKLVSPKTIALMQAHEDNALLFLKIMLAGPAWTYSSEALFLKLHKKGLLTGKFRQMLMEHPAHFDGNAIRLLDLQFTKISSSPYFDWLENVSGDSSELFFNLAEVLVRLYYEDLLNEEILELIQANKKEAKSLSTGLIKLKENELSQFNPLLVKHPGIASDLSSCIVSLSKNNLLTDVNVEILIAAESYLSSIDFLLFILNGRHLLNEANFGLLMQHVEHANNYQFFVERLLILDETMLTDEVLINIIQSGKKANKIDRQIRKQNNYSYGRFFESSSDEESENEENYVSRYRREVAINRNIF